MTNPFTLLPAAVRAWLYFIATVLAAAYAVWQASDGDWKQAVGAAVSAIVTAIARSNVSSAASPEGQALVKAAHTIKQTGGAVEIGGVVVRPVDPNAGMPFHPTPGGRHAQP